MKQLSMKIVVIKKIKQSLSYNITYLHTYRLSFNKKVTLNFFGRHVMSYAHHTGFLL